MKTNFIFSLAAILLACSGCANMNSVHRDFSVNDGKGALIDIKQRAIIVAPDRHEPSKNVVCAEPSPDAMAAYAAELATSGNFSGSANFEAAAGFHESAGFTGLRTQSIQLLRDSFYRICEAYMNGALTSGQYDLLMRRYQKHTVALLAVEQLTGTLKTPTIVITNGSEAANTPLGAILQRKEENNVKIENKKAAKDELNKKSDTDKTTTEKQAIHTIDKDISDLERENQLLNDAFKNISGNKTASSGNAQMEQQSVTKIEAADSVANVVKEIVKGITETDDFMQLCMIYLDNKSTDSNYNQVHDKELKDSCLKRMAAANDLASAHHDVITTALKFVNDSQNPVADRIKFLSVLLSIDDQNKAAMSDHSPGAVYVPGLGALRRKIFLDK